jgi:hypothetical protein
MKTEHGNTPGGAVEFMIFTAFFVVTAAISSISLFGLYPNLNGLGSILISVICGAPIAYVLFFRLVSTKSGKSYQRIIFPALIPPLLSGLLIGWSLYQQRPENIFKVFVADPIPVGISNIKAYDISVGIDQEIVVAFDATPDAIDFIIAENDLELNDSQLLFRGDIPFTYFPKIDPEQDWILYQRADLENINWWFLWVNPDKTIAIFRLIAG